MERQVKLKWEDKLKVFVNEVCKFSRFSNRGLLLLLLGLRLSNSSKMPAGHFSPLVATILGLTILPQSFIGDFVVFLGFDSANMTYARPFSSFANLKCSLRELLFCCLPLKPKHQVMNLVDNSILFHSIFSSQVSECAAFGSVPLPSCPRGKGIPL